MGKSFKKIGGNSKVKEIKGRSFDTYEDLRRCKSGGPHKERKGDRHAAERDAIEASMDADGD
jgi:hypothetical protein